ncbi:MAG: hypothetical protein ACMUIP_18110 [bacterium]
MSSMWQVNENKLKHIGEETQRPPPLAPVTVSINEPDSWYGDYIPPDDVYSCDEEYAD